MRQEAVHAALTKAGEKLAEEDKLGDGGERVLVDALLRGPVGAEDVGEGERVADLLVCRVVEISTEKLNIVFKVRTSHELDEEAVLSGQAGRLEIGNGKPETNSESAGRT